MRVRMNTTAAGPTGVWIAGQSYEIPDDQAKAWIDGGFAQPSNDRAESAKPTPREDVRIEKR